jgi:hypothetical protein
MNNQPQNERPDILGAIKIEIDKFSGEADADQFDSWLRTFKEFLET